MCKGRYKETSYKGYRLQEIYDNLGDPNDIHSIVAPEDSEERLMMRCLGELWFDGDLSAEVGCIDAIVDEWNQILVNLRKKIFWEDLYNKDRQSRVPQAAPETAPAAAPETSHEAAPETSHEAAPEPVPASGHETSHQSVPEATSMPEAQPNEEMQTVLRELAEVKERLVVVTSQLVVVTNRLKTVEEYMEERRQERRNSREYSDFHWTPSRKGFYETGGTSAQGVHETGGTSAQQTAPQTGVHEMGETSAQGVHEMGGPSAAEGVHEMGGTAAPEQQPSRSVESLSDGIDSPILTPIPLPILPLPVQPRRQRFKMCARKSVRPPSENKKRARNPSHYQKSPYTGDGKKKKKGCL